MGQRREALHPLGEPAEEPQSRRADRPWIEQVETRHRGDRVALDEEPLAVVQRGERDRAQGPSGTKTSVSMPGPSQPSNGRSSRSYSSWAPAR